MLYVVLSAFLYVLGTICPALSIITMSTFLIPLLLIGEVGVVGGMLWGCLVFGAAWWWLLVMLQAIGLDVLAYIVYFMIVAWSAAWSCLWLKFFKRFPVSSTVVFFVFISKYSMFFCGVVDGYPLFNPLIPLAFYPWSMNWLSYIPEAAALALLFGFQVSIVACCHKKFMAGSIFASFAFIIIAGLWLPEIKRPVTDKILPIYPWWYKKGSGMFAGYRMANSLSNKSKHAKQGSVLIMPESSFCFDIKGYENFIPIWCDSADGIPILFGTHEIEGSCGHNAVLLLHNSKFLYRYRKQHFLPFLEKSTWVEVLLGKSFLAEELMRPTPKKDSDRLVLCGVPMQLFICSEFFFESKTVSGLPVLLLWNDWWLQCNYAKRLAVLFTVYFEKKYHVPVIHLSTCGQTNLNSKQN